MPIRAAIAPLALLVLVYACGGGGNPTDIDELKKGQKEILERKFEEARRRAAADPTGRPPNPFDNE